MMCLHGGKADFRELESGARIAPQLRMEDESLVRLDLSLDHSEFRSALNFSLFRDSVLALLSGLGNILRDESASLSVMRMLDESGQATGDQNCLACPV